MKKLIVLMSLMFMTATVANADIFGPRGTQESQLQTYGASSIAVDPKTVVDNVKVLTDYLGVRSGVFYDFGSEDTYVLNSATLYTFEDIGVSVSVGMLDTDGAVATVEYNIGQWLPADEIPVAELLEYAYIGVGAGTVKNDDMADYEFAYGLTANIKLTF